MTLLNHSAPSTGLPFSFDRTTKNMDNRKIPLRRLLWLREQACRTGNTAALTLLDRLIEQRGNETAIDNTRR